MNKNYLYKVLLFIDIFLCAIFFRDPDVTISSEAGLAKPPLWAKVLNWILNKIQTDHCKLAITADMTRAYIAIKYLQTKQP